MPKEGTLSLTQKQIQREAGSLKSESRHSFAIFGVVLCLFAWTASACRHAHPEPITITFIDTEWVHDTSGRVEALNNTLRDFTKETGIQIRRLPAPEAANDQLSFIRGMLDKGTVDVVGIDVIWPGLLHEKLLDLKALFAEETSAADPELVTNFTVQDRFIAIPFHVNVGVLLYRADLLRNYGFERPPKSWDELEKMATKIQAGERAKGTEDFWGFLWSGTPGEGLTCNALEWQFSHGGGHIIESNGVITVNNPNTIRAWQRAAKWIGTISPPAALSYREWDAMDMFHNKLKGVFLRTWTSDYFLSHPVDPIIFGLEGITSLPSNSSLRAGALGGFGLAVSRSTAHQSEAVQLVKYLLQKEKEDSARRGEQSVNGPELVDLPAILDVNRARPELDKENSVVARPSTVAGQKYEEVSRAYYRAVFSVLSGKAKAEAAVTSLERQLVQITGFPAKAVRD
jgi:trehalose/maltose transport system substrate-binding protein